MQPVRTHIRRTTWAAVALVLATTCPAVASGSPAVASPVVTRVSPSWGPIEGGTSVSIAGYGLGHVDKVYFGDIPASSFKAISDSELQAVAPKESEGTVEIRVRRGKVGSVEGGNTAFVYVARREQLASPPPPNEITTVAGGGARLPPVDDTLDLAVGALERSLPPSDGNRFPGRRTGDGGPAVHAILLSPSGVAADHLGNVFVSDEQDQRVRKINAAGVITTAAGSGLRCNRLFFKGCGDGAPALAAALNNPTSIAVDRVGNLYIADTGNHSIRMVDLAGGIIIPLAGQSGSGPGFSGDGDLAIHAQLAFPGGVAVDGEGNIYIADTGNARVRRVDALTRMIKTIAGEGSHGFSGDGGPAAEAMLNCPQAVAVDPKGNVFIAGCDYRVRKVDRDGIITTVAGTGRECNPSQLGPCGDGGPARWARLGLGSPGGMAVDAAGQLYLVDRYVHRVRKLDRSPGVITTFAGTGASTVGGDGGGPAEAQIRLPRAVAFNAAGDLYIAGGDQNNARVRKVSSSKLGPAQVLGLVTGPATTPEADLAVSIAGSRDRLKIRVTNEGPGLASGVHLSEEVPPGTEVISARPTAGRCGADGHAVKCLLGNLKAGDSVGVTVSLRRVGTDVATITSVASVYSRTVDAEPANDSATVEVPPADTGRWHTTSSLPGCPATNLACGRYLHTATLLDGPRCRSDAKPGYCGKVLVAGGTKVLREESGAAFAEAALYDPLTSTWSSTTPMKSARYDYTATLLDGPECHVTSLPPDHCGKVLVVGGLQAVGDRSVRAAVVDAELYDPARATWEPTGTPKYAAFSHTATLIGGPKCVEPSMSSHCGKVLVVGGSADNFQRAPLPSAQMYHPERADPATGRAGTWTEVAPPSTARANHTATSLADGRVLFAGGISDFGTNRGNLTALTLTEVYDPAGDSWSAAPDMAVRRFGHTATLLGDGKVLVAGGLQHVFAPTPSAELFDPGAGQPEATIGDWTPVGNMEDPRAGHSATLLADGKVLVAGGGSPFEAFGTLHPQPLDSTEVFDPAAAGWSLAETLDDARGNHSATRLVSPACSASAPPAYCDTVLVAGGYGMGGEGPALASSELYFRTPVVSSVQPDTGPTGGGTTVNITGAHFTTGASVHFGDAPPIPCSGSGACRVDSPTSITVAAPAHRKGPVDVAVISDGGPSLATSAARFLFVAGAGVVEQLSARALSEFEVELGFTAADDGTTSPARDYVIKQSTVDITEASFDAAAPLCEGGVCRFVPPVVGEGLTLAVGDLDKATTYHYAMKAVGFDGQLGPMSRSVSVTTLGTAPEPPAPRCASLPAPVDGELRYAGGRYHLLGLPEGTVVGAKAPLYGWTDMGAGGSYSTQAGDTPVAGGAAYWAWWGCDAAVSLSGPGTSVLTVPLGAYHASMVGNPSGVAPATVNGHDFAARWDAAANQGAGGYVVSAYRDPQSLGVGEGLWVFNYQAGDIVLRAES